MHRKALLGLIASAMFLTKIGPSMAAGAVAAGVPPDVAAHGISLFTQVNDNSVKEAQQKALAGCHTVGSTTSKALCKIVATFSNQCAAEALDPQDGTPGYGWSVQDTSAAAKAQALVNCRATAGPTCQDACVVGDRALWCDGSAK